MVWDEGTTYRLEHLWPAEVKGVRPDGPDYGTVGRADRNGAIHSTGTGYLAIRLDRKLPHIVLQRRRGAMFYAGDGPELELEGDFGKHFELHVPTGYERDALYVLTPDVMQVLIDEAADQRVEIVDDQLFVFGDRVDVTDPEVHARMHRIAAAITAQIVPQADGYRDERVRRDPERPLAVDRVAPAGRRLRRGDLGAGRAARDRDRGRGVLGSDLQGVRRRCSGSDPAREAQDGVMEPELLAAIVTASVFAGGLVLRQRGKKLRFPWLTVVIALVTLVFSVLGEFDRDILDLLRRDGFGLTQQGEWWRIVSPLVVQDGGWPGLIFNLLTLVVLGTLVESIFGARLLAVAYLAAGLISEVAAYTLLQNQGFAGNSVANMGLAGLIGIVAVTGAGAMPARIVGGLSLLAGAWLVFTGNLHGVGYVGGRARRVGGGARAAGEGAGEELREQGCAGRVRGVERRVIDAEVDAAHARVREQRLQECDELVRMKTARLGAVDRGEVRRIDDVGIHVHPHVGRAGREDGVERVRRGHGYAGRADVVDRHHGREGRVRAAPHSGRADPAPRRGCRRSAARAPRDR